MTVLLACYLVIVLFARCFWRNTPPPKGTPKIDRTISDKQRKENLRRLSQAQSVSQQSLEHLYDPKNLNDSCAALHTHHRSSNSDFSFSRAKILELCDIKKLKEEGYTEDFTIEVLMAKNEIKSLMKMPNTKRLVEYIFQENSTMYAMGALFVLLGIKPALVIEESVDDKVFSILTDLAEEHPDLYLDAPKGSGKVYFVNEKPFSFFDPREFLNLSPKVSLRDAVATCFSRQGQRDADQFLSYLLGFGPSWETYAIYTSYLDQERNSVSCVFKRKHYFEIGNVLKQSLFKEDKSKSEIEKLGFTFHSQFASLIGRCDLNKENSSAIEAMLAKTGTKQAFDGLTARTDYFKKSYTLKKWVMDTYFS